MDTTTKLFSKLKLRTLTLKDLDLRRDSRCHSNDGTSPSPCLDSGLGSNDATPRVFNGRVVNKFKFEEDEIKTPHANKHDAQIIHPAGHPKQCLIDGEIWPPIFTADNVRSAKKIVPRDTDVFVCTYPKCGTTWVQHICSQLMNHQYGPKEGKGMLKIHNGKTV